MYIPLQGLQSFINKFQLEKKYIFNNKKNCPRKLASLAKSQGVTRGEYLLITKTCNTSDIVEEKNMILNSLYKKDTFKVLISINENSYLNKGVVLDMFYRCLPKISKKNSCECKKNIYIYCQLPCMVKLLEISINNIWTNIGKCIEICWLF